MLGWGEVKSGVVLTAVIDEGLSDGVDVSGAKEPARSTLARSLSRHHEAGEKVPGVKLRVEQVLVLGPGRVERVALAHLGDYRRQARRSFSLRLFPHG